MNIHLIGMNAYILIQDTEEDLKIQQKLFFLTKYECIRHGNITEKHNGSKKLRV